MRVLFLVLISSVCFGASEDVSISTWKDDGSFLRTDPQIIKKLNKVLKNQDRIIKIMIWEFGSKHWSIDGNPTCAHGSLYDLDGGMIGCHKLASEK